MHETVHSVWRLSLRRTTVVALVALASCVVAAIAVRSPVHAVNPGMRGGIESVITIFAVVAAVLLLLLFRRRRMLSDLLLLGALAAATLAGFLFSARADWVTPGDALRLLAYGLLVLAAAREYAHARRADEQATLDVERERVARDLHDGLAQDLAVIATHGQRLESQLGYDHPLTVAARRALATSRGTIHDLSASSAPSTFGALREVADELEARFEINVSVRDHAGAGAGAEAFTSKAREQIVRIAREAVVNAASHGGARHVRVDLESRGTRFLLRVSDDGSGIDPSALASSTGFGLRTMRARADELGGQVVARPLAAGGTVLELSLATPTRR